MTGQERREAAAYVLTARLSAALQWAALAAGLWLTMRHGPPGLIGGAILLWLARAAKAPMPPDLRDKFK